MEFFSSQGTLQRVCLSECCRFSVFSEALFWVVVTMPLGALSKQKWSQLFRMRNFTKHLYQSDSRKKAMANNGDFECEGLPI